MPQIPDDRFRIFISHKHGDHEFAAAWSAGYNFDAKALYEMMRSAEDSMMREVQPHDGHRTTILDPYATHVAIGLAWEGGEFRITQEFIRGVTIRKKNTGSDAFTSLLGMVLRGRRRYGGYIVHLAIVLMFFGFAGQAYQRDRMPLLRQRLRAHLHVLPNSAEIGRQPIGDDDDAALFHRIERALLQ